MIFANMCNRLGVSETKVSNTMPLSWNVEDSPTYALLPYIATTDDSSFVPSPKEIQHLPDSSRKVVVEAKDYSFMAPLQKKVKGPDILTLSMRKTNFPTTSYFERGGAFTLGDLQRLTEVIFYLALKRHYYCGNSYLHFHEWTLQDYSKAGILLLRDNVLVSVGLGRPKKKNIQLFEHLLVFSRSNSHRHIISHKIPTSSLLVVNYRRQDPAWSRESGTGYISLYWSVEQPGGHQVERTDMFFNDLNALKIWAAFLSSSLSLVSLSASHTVLHFDELLSIDMDGPLSGSRLSTISTLQPLLSLLPLIKSRELNVRSTYDVSKILDFLGARK